MSFGRLLAYTIIFFALAYCLFLINAITEEPAKQSVSQFLKVISDPDAIRSQYGEYGHNFADDYKQYHVFQEPPAAKISLSAPPSFNSPDSLQNPSANHPQRRSMSDPHGIHGNNYSLYDINSPSGYLGKL